MAHSRKQKCSTPEHRSAVYVEHFTHYGRPVCDAKSGPTDNPAQLHFIVKSLSLNMLHLWANGLTHLSFSDGYRALIKFVAQ